MSNKKQKEQSKELGEEKQSMEVGRISFAFNITRDEAEAVVHKSKSLVARKLRKYMISILKAAAEKMLASKENEEVKNCKLEVEKD